jgi:hypothetical protein
MDSTSHARTSARTPVGKTGPPIELLTIDEVADLLRTTPGAIYSQRYRNEAPGSLGVRVGRRILFQLGNLEAFLVEESAAQAAARAP